MRVSVLLATALLTSGPLLATSQSPQPSDQADKDKAKKPSLSIKASPPISFSPATIRVVALLNGGPDDYEELYCPTIEWDWGDGTRSENASDCDPYQPGVSKIIRRFSTSHVYETQGRYRVLLRLKRDTKTLTSANTTVQVRPGVRDIGPYDGPDRD
jgi:hypothetical protein